MDTQWERLFNEISSFLCTIAEQESTASQAMAEQTVVKIENYVHVLYAIIYTLQNNQENDSELRELVPVLYDLVKDLEDIISRWIDIEVGIDPNNPYKGLRAERHHGGGRGRPKYVIKVEQIIFLREIGLTWTRIAVLYGISRRTLYNIRSEMGLIGLTSNVSSQISDLELQSVICDIKRIMPDAGQNMLRGVLQSKGINVSMVRIRDSIAQVDPVNTALRWATPRTRRIYSVLHPNALWHIDGNHKLIRLLVFVHIL